MDAVVNQLAADGDEDDNHLMEAWQHLAQALAASDADDDKDGILRVMDMVKQLLAADGTGQSLPTQSAFACLSCERSFASIDGARSHADTVHRV